MQTLRSPPSRASLGRPGRSTRRETSWDPPLARSFRSSGGGIRCQSPATTQRRLSDGADCSSNQSTSTYLIGRRVGNPVQRPMYALIGLIGLGCLFSRPIERERWCQRPWRSVLFADLAPPRRATDDAIDAADKMVLVLPRAAFAVVAAGSVALDLGNRRCSRCSPRTRRRRRR